MGGASFRKRIDQALELLNSLDAVPQEMNAQEAGFAAAVSRGIAAKLRWVDTREVVPASAIASKWRVTTRSVGEAARRGELSSIVISRRRYFPREFLELDCAVVRAVSLALRPESPESAITFWKRAHGSLGGKTPTTVLCDVTMSNRQQRVVELAQAWAAQSVTAVGFTTANARRKEEGGR